MAYFIIKKVISFLLSLMIFLMSLNVILDISVARNMD
jgi:hypothetical protein